MKVRYTETAAADLDELLRYLIDRNPSAAGDVGAAIEAAVARIAAYPLSAQATDQAGVRMAPAGRFPYLIFYETGDDEVRILRILHGARLRPWDE